MTLDSERTRSGHARAVPILGRRYEGLAPLELDDGVWGKEVKAMGNSSKNNHT